MTLPNSLDILYNTYKQDAGEEAMERNNWASQNSQRVVELKEKEEEEEEEDDDDDDDKEL